MHVFVYKGKVMLKYSNKIVFRYIILLLIVVFLGALFFILSRYYVTSCFDKMQEHTQYLQTQSNNVESINYILEKIHSDTLAFSANTKEQAQREILKQNIQNNALKIDKIILSQKNYLDNSSLEKLGLKYNFSQSYLHMLSLVKPMIEKMIAKSDIVVDLLQKRDSFLKDNNEKLIKVAYAIRDFNTKVPREIANIQKIVSKAKSLLDADIVIFKELVEKKKKEYFEMQFIVYFFVIAIILFVLKLIASHIIKLYEKIEKRLFVDELTGLGSRYAFIKNLEQSEKPKVILLDIDEFRSINELFGIETGNEVLQKLSVLIQKFAAMHNLEVYRISSDEFIFLKEEKDKNILFCKRIINDFLDYYKKNIPFIERVSDTIELEFTFGISTGKERGLAKADMALEYAKLNNLTYKIYTSQIDTIRSLKHNIYWKKEIKVAIAENNFIPFFQPIVDKKGKVVKYEVLARMKKRQEGQTIYISPSKFLNLAIQTKCYSSLSKMIIFQSLNVCFEKKVSLSINIGEKDIVNLDFLKELKEKILQLKIAQKVTFEIVESEDVRTNKYFKIFLEEFKNIGVNFAIDDFGSGFSNFALILETAPDFIKIDGSLIKNIDTDNNSYELVKSIVAFSHALGKKTIAEFVHSKEIFEIAKSLQVDLFQGYYFSEPKINI